MSTVLGSHALLHSLALTTLLSLWSWWGAKRSISHVPRILENGPQVRSQQSDQGKTVSGTERYLGLAYRNHCWMEGHAETEKARSHRVRATVFYGDAARSLAVEWDVQRRLRVSDMRHGGIAKPT